MAVRYAPFGGRQTYLSDVERANQAIAMQNVANQMRGESMEADALSGQIWREHQARLARESRADQVANMQQRSAAGERQATLRAMRDLALQEMKETGEAEKATTAFERRRQLSAEEGERDLLRALAVEEMRQAGRRQPRLPEPGELTTMEENRLDLLQAKEQAGQPLSSAEDFELIRLREKGTGLEMPAERDIAEQKSLEERKQAVTSTVLSDPNISNEVEIARQMFRQIFSGGDLDRDLGFHNKARTDLPYALKQVSQAIDRTTRNAISSKAIPKEYQKLMRDMVATALLKEMVDQGAAARNQLLMKWGSKQLKPLPGPTFAEGIARTLGLDATQEQIEAHPPLGF